MVLYYSKRGSTKRVTEYVVESVEQNTGIDVRLRSLQKVKREDVLWRVGMAVGSPNYLGTVAAEMKRYREDLLPVWQKVDGKLGCTFNS